MNIIYQDLVFPFKETNLERIIDGKYFKINLHDNSQEIRVHLDNEMMLLEFSKSLKFSILKNSSAFFIPFCVRDADLAFKSTI